MSREMAKPREALLHVYRESIERLSGRRLVAEYLTAQLPDRPFHVLAVGKAAVSMTQGAVEVGGSNFKSGLVVHPDDQQAEPLGPNITLITGEHPLPGSGSFQAGQSVLKFIDGLPKDALLLVLLSGGGSSLMEAPWSGISEADLLKVHEWLLASGLDIVDVNRVRQGLSQLKGGGLARQLQGRDARVLCLSDVPEGHLSALTSGPFLPPLEGPLPPLPDWLSVLMGKRLTDPTPAIAHDMLANAATLKQVAGQLCQDWGLPVTIIDGWIEGDAADVGRNLAEQLLAAPPGVLIWSGETTVTLPLASGQGGRCQQLALAAAERLQDQGPVYFLAGGSDGLDGPEGDAGAVVDAETLRRGREGGLNPEDALDWADAGRFLSAAGDLVHIGPTDTNINDLMIGLKLPDSGKKT